MTTKIIHKLYWSSYERRKLIIASNTETTKGIVIIGAGLAGWHVIDAIRAKDKDIPITLIHFRQWRSLSQADADHGD